MLIGIVADDLTGAADSVAPFAKQGYLAGVEFNASEAPEPAWDALAVSTGLRDRHRIKSTLLISIARRYTRRVIKRSPEIYYKKIDSTLRGHLRLELDGMRRELPGRIALICPASPANGRSIENGVLYVGDLPLTQTEFVKEAADPEKFATVRAAFEMADDPAAAEIGLTTIRAGVEAIEAELERLIAAGVNTVFCDAVASEDMQTLAQTVRRSPDRYLPVGSAGLTRALAESLPVNVSPDLPVWDNDLFLQGRILAVVGSMHPMSRRQGHRLIDGTGVRHLILQPEVSFEAKRRAVMEFWDQAPKEKRLVFMTADERGADGWRYSLDMLFYWLAMREEKDPNRSRFDGYVVTGGAMASQLCFQQQGTNLVIFGESEPGIVRAVLHRKPGMADVMVILKAGGFGDEGTLARCLGLE